ncbi:cytosolic Fe-S cluster assembly factor NUBP1-like [Scylla paramamosain]|uniref:cytosolic Fe-S cluster assembly factor NUBP1-like n=1 Tax=Scylla paramamosain TaxID=85552 RepID=UPI003082D0B3
MLKGIPRGCSREVQRKFQRMGKAGTAEHNGAVAISGLGSGARWTGKHKGAHTSSAFPCPSRPLNHVCLKEWFCSASIVTNTRGVDESQRSPSHLATGTPRLSQHRTILVWSLCVLCGNTSVRRHDTGTLADATPAHVNTGGILDSDICGPSQLRVLGTAEEKVHSSGAGWSPVEVALLDVRKEITFCRKVNIPIIGLVENMTTFVCPKCKTKTAVFPATTGI